MMTWQCIALFLGFAVRPSNPFFSYFDIDLALRNIS